MDATEIRNMIAREGIALKPVASDKNARVAVGLVEENALRADANERIRALVGQTDFIGMGGAKINLDGTYEVMADAGSEVLTDKLKEMLTKTFSEDEELNGILGKLKTMFTKKAERSAAVHIPNESKSTDGDTFTPSKPDPDTVKWHEQERIKKELMDSPRSLWYPTPTPHPESDSIQRMEDWLLNGAEFPHDRLKINMGSVDPYTGCSENITLGYA